jgi:hypothetical protein
MISSIGMFGWAIDFRSMAFSTHAHDKAVVNNNDPQTQLGADQ